VTVKFPIWEVWSPVFNFDQFSLSATSTIAATYFRLLPPQNPESRLGVLLSAQPTDGETRLLHLHCEKRLNPEASVIAENLPFSKGRCIRSAPGRESLAISSSSETMRYLCPAPAHRNLYMV
jgi:hypothetical protein